MLGIKTVAIIFLPLRCHRRHCRCPFGIGCHSVIVILLFCPVPANCRWSRQTRRGGGGRNRSYRHATQTSSPFLIPTLAPTPTPTRSVIVVAVTVVPFSPSQKKKKLMKKKSLLLNSAPAPFDSKDHQPLFLSSLI